ncbi:hypothetical protein LF887_11060 [Chryseobacterium sp. MEBOG06]|nr:hypothetical protein [Chryseobacterium sp. MEBOG06]UKB86135.1 hypothetical protein LF887_11060 [Chryseobacterium sp. MEBOG06]
MNPKENTGNKSGEIQQNQNPENDSQQKSGSDKEELPKSSTAKSGTRGG